MKWIKATEDLPELDKWVNTKIDGMPDAAMFYNLPGSVACMSTAHGQIHESGFFRIEWLSEVDDQSAKELERKGIGAQPE